MINQFQKDNDELFDFLLNKKFFIPFKQNSNYFVELFITSDCNLKCEYCYLHKYSDQLYPKEYRDEQLILDNLNSLLKYFIKRDINPQRIDLFSGEIWGTNFSDKIFKILYNYKNKNKQVLLSNITIPSNYTFILNEQHTKKIENWIQYFKDIGITLNFSASIDGLIVDNETRTFKGNNGTERTEENFYNKVFSFCKKHNYGFHPMVAPSSIDKWIENFKWWTKKLSEYEISLDRLMMLEVRNNEWDNTKIEHYLKFLNYCIEYYYNIEYRGRLKEFLYNIFLLPNTEKCYKEKFYTNYSFSHFSHSKGCSITDSLCIRLGDLSIIPCHRTSIDRFIYGQFVKDKDNIICGIRSDNISLALKILTSNPNLYPKCDICNIRNFCIKGCFGAQYENSNELLFPCDSVCKLFNAKYKFLRYKYLVEYNFLDAAKILYKNNDDVQKYLSEIERQVQINDRNS